MWNDQEWGNCSHLGKRRWPLAQATGEVRWTKCGIDWMWRWEREMDDISHRQMNGADIQWNMKVWKKMEWFHPLPVGDVERRWNKRSRDHKCALHEFILNSSIWGTLEIHQRRCHIDSWLQGPRTQWAPGQRISCWAFCASVVMATTVMREIKQK